MTQAAGYFLGSYEVVAQIGASRTSVVSWAEVLKPAPSLCAQKGAMSLAFNVAELARRNCASFARVSVEGLHCSDRPLSLNQAAFQ